MGDNVINNGLQQLIDINLPFFAYGILKPGEIAYSNIKKYIVDKDPIMISYPMKYRDGLPILVPDENDGTVNGFIYTFNDKKEAYETIDQTISNDLYEWGTVNTKMGKANVLFGKDPDRGSVDDAESDLDMENYTGRNDPIFSKVQSMKKAIQSEDYLSQKGFFELQSEYSSVWTALERYCKLKYNKGSDSANRRELLNDGLFINALRNFTDESDYRTIFTSDRLVERAFYKRRIDFCINYYYTIRCNIQHGGKTDSGKDMGLLKIATTDLTNILDYMLEETFNEV